MVAPYQSTLDLTHLDPIVFIQCPDLLNADNYEASQVTAIAQQARVYLFLAHLLLNLVL